METIDALVVGAGVIGLAVARALALDGREVLVVEQADRIGSETSSRNSEVIHAGIYYPPGSLKARLCVAGRERLYEYCARTASATALRQADRGDHRRRRSRAGGDRTSRGPATAWTTCA